MNELYHHGILGQKWGIRRYQNPDGTLTESGKKHLKKMDDKWTRKNADKAYKDAYKKSKKEMNAYVKYDLSRQYADQMRSGRYSKTMINAYNRKLAEVMNKNVSDIESPSGKVIQFVAKRGELGVFTALATKGYDMSRVSKGLWSDGRVAYRKDVINRSSY